MAPLLEVDDVHVVFGRRRDRVEAVSGVSFSITPGETVAVVGESGSGKSVTALAILRLLGTGQISSGDVRWQGTSISTLPEKQLRKIRGNTISMIFQDPMTCLDPLYTIGAQIVEAIRLHRRASRKQAWEDAVTLLDQVGIPDAPTRARAYPHQLSGGQRQRVMIAMALACEPELLIADEPTTALDVTVEAQVLGVMRRMQERTNVAILLITHDMGVVSEMADRVVVMYAGKVVESGTADDVLLHPMHPYTRALLESIPRPDTSKSSPMPSIAGTVPGLTAMPSGCRFRTRCTLAHDRCADTPPVIERSGHEAACWLLADPAPVITP